MGVDTQRWSEGKKCHSPSNSDGFSNRVNDALWLLKGDLILGDFG